MRDSTGVFGIAVLVVTTGMVRHTPGHPDELFAAGATFTLLAWGFACL